jgi:hypothetical protein
VSAATRAGGVRRRQFGGAALMLAALGAATTGLRAQTQVEQRAVAGIRTVRWRIAGELAIEQTGRERLSVEAEPALLARIVTTVHDGQLEIRFAPGRIETHQPIRIRLEVKALEALEADGAGMLRIGPLVTASLSLHLAGSESLSLDRLRARSLDARLDGSGELAIGGGEVEHQRIVIAGAADYAAPRLASREALATIEGSGTARLAATERLRVTIDGSGDVLYLGRPRVEQAGAGSGTVRRVGPGPASPPKT